MAPDARARRMLTWSSTPNLKDRVEELKRRRWLIAASHAERPSYPRARFVIIMGDTPMIGLVREVAELSSIGSSPRCEPRPTGARSAWHLEGTFDGEIASSRIYDHRGRQGGDELVIVPA